LSLNSGKTQVIPSEEVEETLFPYKPRFDEIFTELRTIFEELQEGLLGEIDVEYWEPDAQEIEDAELQVESESIRQLLREELRNAYPNPSVVRFCLKKLRSFGDASVLTDVLNGLPNLVLAIQSAVPYILHVAEDDDDTARNVQTVLSRLLQEPTATTGSSCGTSNVFSSWDNWTRIRFRRSALFLWIGGADCMTLSP